jgi:hypothetical protein
LELAKGKYVYFAAADIRFCRILPQGHQHTRQTSLNVAKAADALIALPRLIEQDRDFPPRGTPSCFGAAGASARPASRSMRRRGAKSCSL